MTSPLDRRRGHGKNFYLLLIMALNFQCWYEASLIRKVFLIGNVKIEVATIEMESFMGDILAIIGKKRNIPFEERSFIAQLLNIQSWSSLNVSLPPNTGCEAFLCRDIGEHPALVRMAMFGLLGLFLKLPYCIEAWRLLLEPRIDDQIIQLLWREVLTGGENGSEYLDWLKKEQMVGVPPLKTILATC
ncbi:hypothetical protein [Pseudomonas chlororaphis]|uniref:hypothetical protein n=1 Tax=Pseudomonas chlororaphis TaxID=587753 RepID=UPI000F583F8C|nr:hypothetical protein [Pseudomonas chlororaphis]